MFGARVVLRADLRSVRGSKLGRSDVVRLIVESHCVRCARRRWPPRAAYGTRTHRRRSASPPATVVTHASRSIDRRSTIANDDRVSTRRRVVSRVALADWSPTKRATQPH